MMFWAKKCVVMFECGLCEIKTLIGINNWRKINWRIKIYKMENKINKLRKHISSIFLLRGDFWSKIILVKSGKKNRLSNFLLNFLGAVLGDC